ncbi:MAG: hypothetical protein VR72_12950 [Clostridiaceae bacterium BRH_c20a]|nr:MAG: hypothetical protein VR72_12950 [Clostridiaceae bacterium BRH_c20a]
MLLPDNIHPELSIYYNGSLVLQELKTAERQPFFDLYQKLKNNSDMSLPTFILTLDWLYLIELAKIDNEGWVQLCS